MRIHKIPRRDTPLSIDGGVFPHLVENQRDSIVSGVFMLRIASLLNNERYGSYDTHVNNPDIVQQVAHNNNNTLYNFGWDLSHLTSGPFMMSTYLYLTGINLASIGVMAFNLSSFRYAHHHKYILKIINRSTIDKGIISQARDSFNLFNYKTSNHSIADDIDKLGSCISIEGHRNAIIGAKVSPKGKLIVETCNTAKSTWTSIYEDMVELGYRYYEIIHYRGERPFLRSAFGTTHGSYGTFDNYPSNYKWLQKKREEFFY